MPTLPLKLKASIQAKIKVVFHAAMAVISVGAIIYFLLLNTEFDLAARGVLAALFAALGITSLQMLCILLPVFIGKRPAAVITERGIENTYIQLNFFVFSILAPIKFIPWSALILTPHPAGKQAEATSFEVFFRIKASALPADCGSPTVKRALANMSDSVMSITFHAAMTVEEAALVRSLMSR